MKNKKGLYIQQQAIQNQNKRIKNLFRVIIPQKIEQLINHLNFIIYKIGEKVIVYDMISKSSKEIQIDGDSSFFIELFDAYIFCAIVGQHFHMYNEGAIFQDQEPLKIKISKLQIKCFCRYNKGYFMGGFNKSRLPGGKRSNRREIYYIEQLSECKNNKPTSIIYLPENQNPVSILIVQKPYLLSYCEPVLFLISITTHQTLMKFQKDIHQILLLEGRYSISTLNLVGLSKSNQIFTVDVQKQPIFGLQISEDRIQNTVQISRSCSGRIYIGKQNEIVQYNPINKQTQIIMPILKQQTLTSIDFNTQNIMIISKVFEGKTIVQIFSVQE